MASRVLHLCADPSFWQFADGTLRRLSEAGFEVHAASSEVRSSSHLSRLPTVTTHDLPLARSIAPRNDVQALAATFALMRRIRPQLVHAHTPKGGLVGMLAARASGVPARIYHVHGLRYESATGALRRLLMNAEQISCGLASRVVCVSNSVHRAAIADGLVSSARARVLHHGSAQGVSLPQPAEEKELQSASRDLLRRHEIPDGAPRAVFVGRLCGDKGVARLPALWTEVQRRMPDARLLVIGSSDPTDPVDLGNLDRTPGVLRLGQLEDVRPALMGARALLLPSLREGLPQCVLEAASMGVPALVSDATGCVDSVVSERTGFVLPLDDGSSWVEQTVVLLERPERAKLLGEAAKNWVKERFRPEPQFEALLQLYAQLGVVPGV